MAQNVLLKQVHTFRWLFDFFQFHWTNKVFWNQFDFWWWFIFFTFVCYLSEWIAFGIFSLVWSFGDIKHQHNKMYDDNDDDDVINENQFDFVKRKWIEKRSNPLKWTPSEIVFDFLMLHMKNETNERIICWSMMNNE